MDAAGEIRTGRTRWFRLAWAALGIALLAIAWLQGYVVRQETLLGILLIVAAIAAAGISVATPLAARSRAAVPGLAALVALAQLTWFAASWYPAWVLSQASAIVLGFLAFGVVWTLRPRGVTAGRVVLRAGGGLAVAVAVIVSAALITTSISPRPVVTLVQNSGGYGNSFQPAAEPGRTVVQDNTLLINDLKTMGDPNAGAAAFALSNGPMIQAGYNLVALDYALAPEYTYPTPVIQLSQAISFLQDHAEEYGLDMSRVVIGGGSAGGHIAAQFAVVQTNPAFATEIGIKPVLAASALKAVALDSAALDASRAGRTEAADAFNDWQFTLAARAYLEMSGFPQAGDAGVDQADIITHVSAQFPPAFIADGNYGTFPDQAQDLSDRLTALSVTNELLLPPLSEAKLGHGYMGLSESKYVDDYNAKKIAFLATVVG
ncbi:putative esterase [Actinoplanes lutulentus]|uniref:Alpha/beta hydrolase family protein n=1 Tax=Actinoplanes lutulentus TaxID=1287878 RepID=A0A327Z510_9ACTN|nr:alpha/beta hydrolase [Actinoplanes lutulentus]MBB2949100.1 putative esterase [Actinoplanes lutulentus]RAK31421.1 alpha/beta hydrolase family protein [Actinoplanes lutulentus]